MSDSSINPSEGVKPTLGFSEAQPPVEEMLIGVVLVACPEELESAIGPLMKSVTYQISTNPLLADMLTIAGPERLSRSGRWKLIAGAPDSKRVRSALRKVLSQMQIEQSSLVAIGVIVIDQNIAAVAERITHIGEGPELIGLPLQLHGVSLTPARDNVPPEITAVDPSYGPVRIDNLIIQTAKKMLERAESGDGMVLPAPVLAAMTNTSVEPDSTDRVVAVPLPDEQVPVTPRTPGTVANGASHGTPRQSSTKAGPVQDRYVVREGLPLRLTYMVVALGAESRPKEVRKRITGLIVELDHALVPDLDVFASKTILVPAGQGQMRDREPRMLKTGDVTEDLLTQWKAWKPTTDFLDMTQTMEQVASLLTENQASCMRRSQPLMRPLIIFIMPTASMSGARCLSYYRTLKDRADIGWLITNRNASSPNPEIDTDRLVVDKEDVINELMFAVGYPIGTAAQRLPTPEAKRAIDPSEQARQSVGDNQVPTVPSA